MADGCMHTERAEGLRGCRGCRGCRDDFRPGLVVVGLWRRCKEPPSTTTSSSCMHGIDFLMSVPTYGLVFWTVTLIMLWPRAICRLLIQHSLSAPRRSVVVVYFYLYCLHQAIAYDGCCDMYTSMWDNVVQATSGLERVPRANLYDSITDCIRD